MLPVVLRTLEANPMHEGYNLSSEFNGHQLNLPRHSHRGQPHSDILATYIHPGGKERRAVQ